MADHTNNTFFPQQNLKEPLLENHQNYKICLVERIRNHSSFYSYMDLITMLNKDYSSIYDIQLKEIQVFRPKVWVIVVICLLFFSFFFSFITGIFIILYGISLIKTLKIIGENREGLEKIFSNITHDDSFRSAKNCPGDFFKLEIRNLDEQGDMINPSEIKIKAEDVEKYLRQNQRSFVVYGTLTKYVFKNAKFEAVCLSIMSFVFGAFLFSMSLFSFYAFLRLDRYLEF